MDIFELAVSQVWTQQQKNISSITSDESEGSSDDWKAVNIILATAFLAIIVVVMMTIAVCIMSSKTDDVDDISTNYLDDECAPLVSSNELKEKN
ncbi:hypothetical protein CHS0354_029911 [Potamilus streckersoni]|uniref:Uncharacterized protein n=1 Tax=Potamilus streckersoni TaxID=2493646 RepID=A0AAE0RST5_9BIVA|nr:hypothetical protein CHS0354_029911 [Potamilus streckersoni]